jgi:hypothetical protein
LIGLFWDINCQGQDEWEFVVGQVKLVLGKISDVNHSGSD